MVPVVDLARRGQRYAQQFAAIAGQVAASGEILLGQRTRDFEAHLSAWSGGSPAVTVSSGAGAIQLALAALGIGPGDEVLVPAFTAVPTASAVVALGAIPVPIDVLASTATLDPAGIEAARTAHTKALIVVHLYGRPADVPITDLLVVEDAAQAQGALHDYTRSAAVAYSFYPTKNLGGIGDGGAVVTADADLAERIRIRRGHGMTAQYVHEVVSQNFRMSELEAAWLDLGLDDLDSGNQRRRHIAGIYRRSAPQLCWQEPHPDHTYHLCVFRSQRREAVRQQLQDRGVATAIHYPLALTQQPAYRAMARHACPESEAWAATCITVPCFPELTDDEIAHVAEALSTVDR